MTCGREDRLADGTRLICGSHPHGPQAPAFQCRACLLAEIEDLRRELAATKRRHLRAVLRVADLRGGLYAAKAQFTWNFRAFRRYNDVWMHTARKLKELK